MIYIYEIYNKVTGRKYIGQTIDHVKRFKTHILNLQKGTHTEKLMQRDFVLYGKESFDYRILEIVHSRADAIKSEKHYMIINKTYEDEFGYNAQDSYFNRYQNAKTPVNAQNYLYKKAQETGLSLTHIASLLGISCRTLIRNFVHPRRFSVSEFTRLVDLLGLDRAEVTQYMGWCHSKSISREERAINDFCNLDENIQEIILMFVSALHNINLTQERKG